MRRNKERRKRAGSNERVDRREEKEEGKEKRREKELGRKERVRFSIKQDLYHPLYSFAQ